MTTLFSAQIPTPPTVNNMFVNVKGEGRYKSKEYREWRKAAISELHAQMWTQPKGRHLEQPIDVFLDIQRPTKTSDVDNRIKPILDALQEAGVIADDRYVEAVFARWSPHPDAKGAKVSILPAWEVTRPVFDQIFSPIDTKKEAV